MEKFAEYRDGNEKHVIYRYPNGKFYNHYSVFNTEFDGDTAFGISIAGGFETLIEAENMMAKHRPMARKIDLEPSKEEIIGWIMEHEQAWEDFKNYFPYYRTYDI